jgi:hypothetical protein
MRDTVHAMRMQRAPVSKAERLATDAVAWTLTARAKRAAADRHAGGPELFPSRRMERWDDADAEETDAEAVVRMCGQFTTPPPKPTPTAPEADSRAVADLPRTRAAADALVGKPLVTGAFRTKLRWEDSRPDPNHARGWGRILDMREMNEELRVTFARLIEKDVTPGSIERVDFKDARFVCPIFLDVNEAGKGRLIHDLRPLNRWMKTNNVSYARVRDAIDLCRGRRDMVASKLDLRSAFRHVGIDKQDGNWLCFAVRGVDGKVQAWRWATLPFGATASPDIFWDALQPALEALKAAGVIHLAYVDDILIMARSAAELDEAMVKTMNILAERGWQVAAEKTYPYAHDRVVFLGLRVDIDRGKLAIPAQKINKLKRRCRAATSGTRVTLEELQKINGLLSFFMEAVPTLGLFRRNLIDATTEASRLPGRHVWRQGGLAAELTFWAGTGADELTAREAWDHDVIGDVQHLAGATDSSEDGAGGIGWKGTAPTPDLGAWTGGPPTGHLWRETDDQTILAEALPTELLGASSTARELGGLLGLARRMIARGWLTSRRRRTASGWEDIPDAATTTSEAKEDDSLTMRRTTTTSEAKEEDDSTKKATMTKKMPTTTTPRKVKKLQWFCDSQAAVGAKKKWRSPSAGVEWVMMQILQITIEYDLEITGSWVSREYGWIPAADFLSRVVGRRLQAEWAVDAADFLRLTATATDDGCHDWLDAWASRGNRRCSRYRSRYPERESGGPALSAPWTGPTWAFPPHSMTARALRFWQEECAETSSTLLLVHRTQDVPGWTAARTFSLRYPLAGPPSATDPLTRTSMSSEHLTVSMFRR